MDFVALMAPLASGSPGAERRALQEERGPDPSEKLMSGSWYGGIRLTYWTCNTKVCLSKQDTPICRSKGRMKEAQKNKKNNTGQRGLLSLAIN